MLSDDGRETAWYLLGIAFAEGRLPCGKSVTLLHVAQLDITVGEGRVVVNYAGECADVVGKALLETSEAHFGTECLVRVRTGAII